MSNHNPNLVKTPVLPGATPRSDELTDAQRAEATEKADRERLQAEAETAAKGAPKSGESEEAKAERLKLERAAIEYAEELKRRENEPKAPKAAAGEYVVAPGTSVNGPLGHVNEGEAITIAHCGGQENFDTLIKAKQIVRA